MGTVQGVLHFYCITKINLMYWYQSDNSFSLFCTLYVSTVHINAYQIISHQLHSSVFSSAVLILVLVLVQSTKNVDFKLQFQSPGHFQFQFQSSRRKFAEFQFQFQSLLVLVTQVSHQNECDYTQVNHTLNNW